MSFWKTSRSARISWAGLLILPMLAAPFAWAEPTQEELEAASRLTARATFGMSYEQLVAMAEQGLDEWLDEQLDMECTSFVDIEQEIRDMDEAGEYDEIRERIGIDEGDSIWFVDHFDMAWTNAVLYGDDQLCQRVAWALSQIFVVSRREIDTPPFQWTTYYDNLVRGAFGDFRELLEDVTYSAQMGIMLSHVNNSRPRTDPLRYPDQNYARELMQLFSLGLFELNPDGTRREDENGATIPTYDSQDIAELARVMTGLSFYGEHASFGSNQDHVGTGAHEPMMMFKFHHDEGRKVIVGGTEIPAGQEPHDDIEQALDAIFEHANTGPFIVEQLIQHLVTSNPTPEYIQRVAEAFANDGDGTRGNMKHVIRTILTDSEALEPANPETFGKLKDPLLRLISLDRMFPLKPENPNESFWPGGLHSYNFHDFLGIKQVPMQAPHVFNFYSPFFSPKGELSDSSLTAPAFQVFDMQTTITASNMVWTGLLLDHSHWTFGLWYDDDNGDSHRAGGFVPNYEGYLEMADTPEDLVDRLDLVMCHGRMTDEARGQLEHRIGQIDFDDDDEEDYGRHNRVAFAVWYITNLPEFNVET